MILRNSLFPLSIIIYLLNFSTFSAQRLQVPPNQDVRPFYSKYSYFQNLRFR